MGSYLFLYTNTLKIGRLLQTDSFGKVCVWEGKGTVIKKYKSIRKSVSGETCVAWNFIKKTSAQVFFCEYSEIFKNTYFEKHLQTTASQLVVSKYMWNVVWWYASNSNQVCTCTLLMYGWDRSLCSFFLQSKIGNLGSLHACIEWIININNIIQ